MQVVAGRHPRMSDIPDMLPDTDMSARLHMQPVHMCVQCRVSFRMPDMHEPSVTPAVTCLGDPAVTRTVHGGATGSGQVHSLVEQPPSLYRMHPHTERGRDPETGVSSVKWEEHGIIRQENEATSGLSRNRSLYGSTDGTFL
ncbi:hypothetical protein CQW36_00035 [Bacteroides fragilis]|nr:hypothetical protein CQW36_00035 [Bacteroides fragilis]